MIRRTSFAVWSVLVLAVCQPPRSSPPHPTIPTVTAPAADPPPRATPFNIEELTLLLADRAPNESERALGPKVLTGDATAIEQVVDALLADAGFLKNVGPRILVGPRLLTQSSFAVPANWVLLTDKQADETVYRLRWAPACTAKQAVRVAAWWNPAKPVLICPTSYRPELFTSARNGKACDAMGPVVDSDTDCGCGPNLVRCLPDEATWTAMLAALAGETRATVAHLLAENAPIADVFTTNATARTRYAELTYRRWLVEDKRLNAIPDLDGLQKWSLDEPRWAERTEALPGQHAGVLTDTNTAFGSNGQRALMRLLTDILWCVGEDSSDVDSAVVLTLGKEIRGSDGSGLGAGWEQLAARKVCTNCHARLDYSGRAWLGFPDQRVALHFLPSKQLSGKRTGSSGPLYFDSIDDKRGEMRLDPLGWAKAVTAQPEFGTCMTRRVVSHVFADGASDEDREAIAAQFSASGRLRDMMRVAAVRYVQRRTAHAAPMQSAASPNLEHLVKSLCKDCHDFYDKRPPNRAELTGMLEMVYLERMPKKHELTIAARRELVRAIGSMLGQTSSAFFEDGFRSYSVHRPELMTAIINDPPNPAAKGGGPKPPRTIENAIDPAQLEYTPAFALELSVSAVQACAKSEGGDKTPAGLAACAKRRLANRTGIRASEKP